MQRVRWLSLVYYARKEWCSPAPTLLPPPWQHGDLALWECPWFGLSPVSHPRSSLAIRWQVSWWNFGSSGSHLGPGGLSIKEQGESGFCGAGCEGGVGLGSQRDGQGSQNVGWWKNEIMPFAATWMDLAIITVSEVSQAENLKKWYKWTCLQNRITDSENRFIVTKGESEGGGRIN